MIHDFPVIGIVEMESEEIFEPTIQRLLVELLLNPWKRFTISIQETEKAIFYYLISSFANQKGANMRPCIKLLKAFIASLPCFLCIIPISQSNTYAQSFNPQSYEIFDLLEKLYPNILSPQATYIQRFEDLNLMEKGTYLHDTDKDVRLLYRRYKDFDIKTDHFNLYFYDHNNKLTNFGSIDLWLPFLKAEVLFDWFEEEYPTIFSPQQQGTKFEAEIYYRSYADTNITIGIHDNHVYLLDINGLLSDNPPALLDFGTLDYWITENAMKYHEYILGGVYTIHNKYTNLCLCAGSPPHLQTAPFPYNLWEVAKFLLIPLGNYHYKIQPYGMQSYGFFGYYLYGSQYKSRNYRVISIDQDWGDAVTWTIRKLPMKNNEYKIQQKSSGRFMYDSPYHGPVTIDSDWGDSITWIIEHNPYDTGLYNDDIMENHEYLNDDMEIYSIEYLFDQTTINNTRLVNRACVTSPDPYASTITLTYKEKHIETSFFQHTQGYQITVGTEISMGIPKLAGGATLSFEVSKEESRTWGEEESSSKEWEITNSIEVDPGTRVQLCGYINEIDVSIPYIMLYKSKSINVVHQSKGVWRGKLGTDVIFETNLLD